MEETIARLVQAFVAFGLAYTIALWVALVLWTWRDISNRSDNPLVQILSTLVVLLFFAPGAVIYLMLRPRETLDDAYQRSVAEEYLIQDLEEFPACPSCRRPLRDDFVFCPNCRAELRRPCAGCGRLIDLRWDVCAYCGEAGHPHRSVAPVWEQATWSDTSASTVEISGVTNAAGMWVPSSGAISVAENGAQGTAPYSDDPARQTTSARAHARGSEPRPGG